MNHLVYYLFLKPISLLPYRILYGISDFLYLILYKLFKYRVKVVAGNLQRSFPEKSEQERKQIERAFYSHFFDLIMESVKQFSITKEQVLKRVKVTNYEALNEFARQGKSTFLLAGHYGNWELAAIAYELKAEHKACGIYHPLKSEFWNRKLSESRSKLGMALVSKKELNGYFERTQTEMITTMFGTDQSPSNVYKAYWLTFLNQDTPVCFGAEKYAIQYDQPVFWGNIKKLKRGYYEISFELITDQPRQTEYGEITEAHVRMLEKQIRETPQHWLWTHKRWKRTKPADYADKQIVKASKQAS